jgi:hypothetical protein
LVQKSPRSQNSFIILKFPAGVMKEIVAKLRSSKFCYFEKNLESPSAAPFLSYM